MNFDIEGAYFYKHLRSSKGSRAIIDTGTIRFTNPKDFNDPFDCKYKVESSFLPTASELGNIQQKLGDKALPPHQRMDMQRKARYLHESGKGDFHNMFPDIGVCCLNRNPLSILMWSHYAQSHTGFMVEMAFPEEANHFNSDELTRFAPLEVQYDDSFPHLTNSDKTYINEISRTESNKFNIVQKAMLTKSKEWEYEKEWRVIDLNQTKDLNSENNFIRKYPRQQLLHSVTAGINISAHDFRELQKSVETAEAELNKKIPIYTAEIIEGKYQLHVPNHPFLDKKHF